MIDALERLYRRHQFHPGWVGPWLNPFFLARRALWQEVARAAGPLRGRLLDVGCGTKPYRSLFQVDDYVGLELDTPEARRRGGADAYYDGQRFPFPDAAFDVVLCNQVLEHVFTPDAFVGELARVLRRGGTLVLTVPFVWDEHEQPFDYARYSSFGARALLEEHGLKVREQRKLLADSSMLFQLAAAYLHKVTSARSRLLGLLGTPVLIAPLSVAGLLAGQVLPGNPDLYLDQLVVAERT